MDRSPLDFFSQKPGVILIAGTPKSGRSALISVLKPGFHEQYLPEFVHQRKDVFGNLFARPKHSVIAIKTNLPNIHDSSDGFLMELRMTANTTKQTYLVEWGMLPTARHDSIVSDTCVKYVNTIFVTTGYEDLGERLYDEPVLTRFATIDDLGDEETSLRVKYKVVYHEQNKSISNPEYTFRTPWRHDGL